MRAPKRTTSSSQVDAQKRVDELERTLERARNQLLGKPSVSPEEVKSLMDEWMGVGRKIKALCVTPELKARVDGIVKLGILLITSLGDRGGEHDAEVGSSRVVGRLLDVATVAANTGIYALWPGVERPDLLERISEALATLRGAQGVQFRRESVRQLVWELGTWRTGEQNEELTQVSEKTRLEVYELLVKRAIAYELPEIDERFENLEFQRVLKLLGRFRPALESPRGGAGNWGVFRVAAELSVSVGGFGDKDVGTAVRDFRAAYNKTRRTS